MKAYYRFLVEHGDASWSELGDVSLKKGPALVEAHRLRWSLDAEDRAIVEARLLARESDADIGRKSGISSEAVDHYEAIFFCVRDRLDASAWIVETIRNMAGPGLPHGEEAMGERQRHMVYRLFGYFGGPLILDATIGALSTGSQPVNPQGCPVWLDDHLRAQIRRVALMTVATFDTRNVHRLSRAHLDLIKQKTRNPTPVVSVEKNLEAVAKNIGALIDS